MVGGPNGSGKTTLTRALQSAGVDFARYINPDDIATELSGSYDERVRDAQRRADADREDCLRKRQSFSFETVMSHRSKIEILAEARQRGYKVVFYFVATDDPVINIHRVSNRVAQGGHDVDAGRIVARYFRSMELMSEAMMIADAAYIFDNSSDEPGRALSLIGNVQSAGRTHTATAFRSSATWLKRELRMPGATLLQDITRQEPVPLIEKVLLERTMRLTALYDAIIQLERQSDQASVSVVRGAR
jgi:predicted ABC-type ATPase